MQGVAEQQVCFPQQRHLLLPLGPSHPAQAHPNSRGDPELRGDGRREAGGGEKEGKKLLVQCKAMQCYFILTRRPTSFFTLHSLFLAPRSQKEAEDTIDAETKLFIGMISKEVRNCKEQIDARTTAMHF